MGPQKWYVIGAPVGALVGVIAARSYLKGDSEVVSEYSLTMNQIAMPMAA